jgi:hypothetical protein
MKGGNGFSVGVDRVLTDAYIEKVVRDEMEMTIADGMAPPKAREAAQVILNYYTVPGETD